MKVVLLAGGLGTRIAEETETKPKPMVEIGQRPLLWHIMKHYAHFGFKEFVVALGYRGEYVKRYFLDYCTVNSNLTVNLANGRTHYDVEQSEDWLIDLIDTGDSTQTAGRLKRLGQHLTDTFMLTYGDGVSNINLANLLAFHRSHGKLATLSAVRPPTRFGHLTIEGSQVAKFSEKPQIGEGWINGGFFVMEPQVLDYIEGDDVDLARGPFENLANNGQLMAYKHDGFWQCMDTMRDKDNLEKMWSGGRPEWKVWA